MTCQSRSILIVENEPQIALIINQILDGEGYAVFLSDLAGSALDILIGIR